jgi:hypothetical protein
MLRGHGWMRLSALRSLFIAGSESIFFVRRRRQSSGTKCRDNGAGRVIASVSEAIQMGLRKNLDCFVAVAPRNDEDA